MSGKLVSVEVKFPNWIEKLRRAEPRIGLFLAAQVQTNRAMLFANEGAYNGHAKWAPLKAREGQILSLSGALKNSMGPSNAKGIAGPNGDVSIGGSLKAKYAKIGTKLKYAALMNFGTKDLPGGVLRAKKKVFGFGRRGVLRFKANGKWVFAQSVKIPARRFDQFNAQDKLELQIAMTNFVTRVLNDR